MIAAMLFLCKVSVGNIDWNERQTVYMLKPLILSSQLLPYRLPTGGFLLLKTVIIKSF